MTYNVIALIAKRIYAFEFLSFLEFSKVGGLGYEHVYFNSVFFSGLLLNFLQATFGYICYNVCNVIIVQEIIIL